MLFAVFVVTAGASSSKFHACAMIDGPPPVTHQNRLPITTRVAFLKYTYSETGARTVQRAGSCHYPTAETRGGSWILTDRRRNAGNTAYCQSDKRCFHTNKPVTSRSVYSVAMSSYDVCRTLCTLSVYTFQFRLVTIWTTTKKTSRHWMSMSIRNFLSG